MLIAHWKIPMINNNRRVSNNYGTVSNYYGTIISNPAKIKSSRYTLEHRLPAKT